MRPAFGEWRSLVAHFVRDEGVGGSNPLSPTNRLSAGIWNRRISPESTKKPASSLDWRVFYCLLSISITRLQPEGLVIPRRITTMAHITIPQTDIEIKAAEPPRRNTWMGTGCILFQRDTSHAWPMP